VGVVVGVGVGLGLGDGDGLGLGDGVGVVVVGNGMTAVAADRAPTVPAVLLTASSTRSRELTSSPATV
jgi:hypothetical protein